MCGHSRALEILANKLNTDSLPHKWFEAFLPSYMTSLWTSHTNLKAILLNAGQEGEVYPEFEIFSPVELRKHIALYFVQGLSPSPTIDMKFKSQDEDDINGNDF